MVTELVWKIVFASILLSLGVKFVFNSEIDGYLVFSASVIGLFALFFLATFLEELILKKRNNSNKNSNSES
jgi:RsiW-degrading membrane proteinase PrsW (M82 family)